MSTSAAKHAPASKAEEQPAPVKEQPAAVVLADSSGLLYVNADGTKIVAAGSAEAAFVLNPTEPGRFRELLKKHRESARASGGR